MPTFIEQAILLLTLMLISMSTVADAPPGSNGLEIRFLANAGIEISDGKTTIYTDFPYQSGAYNFMTYDISTAQPKGETLCLITHRHADHFDANAISKFGCTVLGPADVISRVKSNHTLALDNHSAKFGAAVITAIETPHADMGHYSYRVDWAGKQLYFVGDTDQTSFVYAENNLDILFITPWLLGASTETNAPLSAIQVVVYHHRGPPDWKCSYCIIPEQGQSIDVPE